MAEKDPDSAALAGELLNRAQLRLATHLDAEVEGFKASQTDAEHASGEKRAKRLIACARALACIRQAGPKADKGTDKAGPSGPPPPPANENTEMDAMHDPDGLDALSDEELRAHVRDRLERFARQFEAKHMAGATEPGHAAEDLTRLACAGGAGAISRSA